MVRIMLSLVIAALLMGCSGGSEPEKEKLAANASVTGNAESVRLAQVLPEGKYCFGSTGVLRMGTTCPDTVYVCLSGLMGGHCYGMVTPQTKISSLNGEGATTDWLRLLEGELVTLMGSGAYDEFLDGEEFCWQAHGRHRIEELRVLRHDS